MDWQKQSAPGDTKHIARYDFSVATATQNIAAENDAMPQDISLGFKHLLSALQLQVTNETGAELTVKEIRLSAAGGQIAYNRAYDVAAGKLQTGGDLKSDYLKLEIEHTAALASGGTESQDFHMLFFPGYENTNMTITVITDRGEYTLTKGAPTSPGFEAGHNYLTGIAIKSSNLDPDKETWTEYVGISTAAELAAFRDNVNNGNTYQGKTVRLLNDIAFTTSTGETWTPIGNSTNKFQGTFDGGGHHISNLRVNTYNNGYAGLFGYVDGGTVRNLRVSGTVKTTGTHAGGIVGINNNSNVENCIFDGNVSGSDNVGGIAGDSKITSRIAGCHTKGTVTTTTSNAGGIAGYNVGSAINGCYSEAEVTAGSSSAGGIAGLNEYNGTVIYCYATGKVSGKNYVGGIVGDQYNNSTLTGCIALNPGLTRTKNNLTYFGRIVGNNDGGTVNSCAAYSSMTLPNGITATSAADGIHGTALTRDQCLTKDTYTTCGFAEPTATTSGWAFDAANTPVDVPAVEQGL